MLVKTQIVGVHWGLISELWVKTENFSALIEATLSVKARNCWGSIFIGFSLTLTLNSLDDLEMGSMRLFSRDPQWFEI